MEIFTITRRYFFEAAHYLPKVPDDHRCKRMHGHNYKVDVTVIGELDQQGFVVDFAVLDELVKPLCDIIDHRCLNDIPGLENPTAELIASWFYGQIRAEFPYPNGQVASVTVWETDFCSATFQYMEEVERR